MIETRPTWIIYRGAGCPAVMDAKRAPVRTHAATRCGRCGDASGVYRFADVVSDNFIPTSNSSVLLGGVDSLCVACAFCARDLKLRCAAFFARESGIFFVRTRHLLPCLLDPPEPPFVAVLPLYGVRAGESAGWRALWSTDPPLPAGLDVLARMQAKCTAPYAETAVSRVRYPLQVDADRHMTVDVPLWRSVVDAMDRVAERLRAAGCGAGEILWLPARPGHPERIGALMTLRPPSPAPWHDARALASVVRDWRTLTAPIRPHVAAPWYRHLLAKHLYRVGPAADAATEEDTDE